MESYEIESQFESSKPKLPVSLKIVAVLFILSGIGAAIEVLASLMRGGINVNLGVLGIFVGIGLFNLKAGWRTCGLVFLWFGMILIPVVGLLAIVGSGQAHYNVFGIKGGSVPMPVALGVAVFFFCIVLWQYRVLTRPDIRELFVK